jgi:hypothetical protein
MVKLMSYSKSSKRRGVETYGVEEEPFALSLSVMKVEPIIA